MTQKEKEMNTKKKIMKKKNLDQDLKNQDLKVLMKAKMNKKVKVKVKNM